ncbi:MAG: FAD-dependent oxidoreductase [Myxococcota bacterium]
MSDAARDQSPALQPGPRRPRIAVVGAGIAGTAAAWALNRSGFPVTLLEESAALGGNARTHRWRGAGPGGADLESPLLVIAWPGRFYHNYHRLLDTLGVARTSIPIRYFVKHPAGVFTQDGEGELDRLHRGDLARWARLVQFVRRVNERFLGADRSPSMYRFAYGNPLNVVPLYRLARLFGLSEAFWERIFVPVHVATVITRAMRDMPAVVAPLLEDIVPLERPTEMTTWVGSPREVFERMTADFASSVHTQAEVVSVEGSAGAFRIRTRAGPVFEADRVVLACQAPAALRVLAQPTGLERRLLARVRYVDHDPRGFSRFTVHSDASILPAEDRARILRDFNTYVELDGEGGLECTFVLSAGNPNLAGATRPLLVTWHSRKPIDSVEGSYDLPNATHVLSLRNLANMLLLRGIQGRRGLWFCSGYTTPEGAHDLSFLSGLVVAHALGADYPFGADALALADFRQMRRIMLGRAARAGQPARMDGAHAA